MLNRRHGKLLEEGASGYLAKKLGSEGNREAVTENAEVDWCSFNKCFSDHASGNNTLFGSEHWASVYLASTPQQAAVMGIKFPGVDEVANMFEFILFSQLLCQCLPPIKVDQYGKTQFNLHFELVLWFQDVSGCSFFNLVRPSTKTKIKFKFLFFCRGMFVDYFLEAYSVGLS